MNILAPFEPALVREKLARLLEKDPQSGAASFDGVISPRQILIRIPRRRFSLPWQPTFRGAALPFEAGTLITGKFDSNWSLHFLGYPILAAVFINIALNIISGRSNGRLSEFVLFTIFAAGFCLGLSWADRRGRRAIATAMSDATQGLHQ